ncbi:hypothetical protein EMIHUDRAFT_440446, partial [Emiliania huxleyi CCMP1516]
RHSAPASVTSGWCTRGVATSAPDCCSACSWAALSAESASPAARWQIRTRRTRRWRCSTTNRPTCSSARSSRCLPAPPSPSRSRARSPTPWLESPLQPPSFHPWSALASTSSSRHAPLSRRTKRWPPPSCGRRCLASPWWSSTGSASSWAAGCFSGSSRWTASYSARSRGPSRRRAAAPRSTRRRPHRQQTSSSGGCSPPLLPVPVPVTAAPAPRSSSPSRVAPSRRRAAAWASASRERYRRPRSATSREHQTHRQERSELRIR